MKLMARRVVVGMNTVNMLLIIGLPIVTSTTIPSLSSNLVLHICILCRVYLEREIALFSFKLRGFSFVNFLDIANSILHVWMSNGYQLRA